MDILWSTWISLHICIVKNLSRICSRTSSKTSSGCLPMPQIDACGPSIGCTRISKHWWRREARNYGNHGTWVCRVRVKYVLFKVCFLLIFVMGNCRDHKGGIIHYIDALLFISDGGRRGEGRIDGHLYHMIFIPTSTIYDPRAFLLSFWGGHGHPMLRTPFVNFSGWGGGTLFQIGIPTDIHRHAVTTWTS